MALDPSTFSGNRSRLALGPKDWIPKGILNVDPDTDLLTKEDRERLEKIYKAAKAWGNEGPDGQFLSITQGDVIWLAEALDQMAALRRIDDFVFPEYVAVIDAARRVAFAVRYKSRLTGTAHLEVSGPGEILSRVFDSISHASAVLLVRPVFKVSKGDLEKFRELRFQLSVDGQIVLDEPFDRHIVPGDGRLPFAFGNTTEKLGTIYQSGRLDAYQQAYPDRPLGIFLAKGQKVRIDALIHGSIDPVELKVSLLGAVYTTEAVGGGAEVVIRACGAP